MKRYSEKQKTNILTCLWVFVRIGYGKMFRNWNYRGSFIVYHLLLWFVGVKQWRKYYNIIIIECVIGGCGRFNNHNTNKKKKTKEGVITRNSATKTNIIILRRHPCNYRHPCRQSRKSTWHTPCCKVMIWYFDI